MNRRHFLGSLAATVGASALVRASEETPSTVLVPASEETPSTGLVRTPLVLMAPRPDGIEAVWAVSRLAKGKLEWEGNDGSSGTAGSDPFGFVPQGEEVLRARLDGLRPGREYRVRSLTTAADDGTVVTSPWKTFRTLDPGANASRFVVWNDTHIHNETIQKLHEATPAADFLVWNGDTCNDWTRRDLLIPTLLHPGERDITEGRPLFITMGNHDVRGPRAFEMPLLIPTPNGRPFHAIRSGPIAAIFLHTGEDKPDDHPSFGGRVAFDPFRHEQARWLAEVIRQPGFKDAPYRIVFCHIPLRWVNERTPDYERGGFDRFSLRGRDAWHQSLVEWQTQLIISGHTHRAAWVPPTSDFPYGQLIGGGPQLASATWIEAQATHENLTIQVHDLQGTIRETVQVQPVA